jgi:hypothetical protein
MKKIRVYILCIISIVGVYTSKANNGKEKEAIDNTQRIAFLGIDNENLHSNYFSDETIAEKMNVPEDSINETFNRHFFEILNNACIKNSKINMVYCCFEEGKRILESVKYDNKGDEMESDISGISQGHWNHFFEKTSTAYLMLVDQYYIKKEGYPYHNISHIIAYSLYDKNKKIVFRGRHQFSSLDMDDFSHYAKQFSKIANKLLAKMN